MNRTWIELSVQTDGGDRLQARISGGTGGRSTPASPVEGVSVKELLKFTRVVRRLAKRGESLSSDQRAWASGLYARLLDRERAGLVQRLQGQGGPVLLKLMVSDPALRGVPWEVVCPPGGVSLGCSPDLQMARGVFSSRPAIPREIPGAVRVLAVAPEETAGSLSDMRDGLEDAIASGQIEWLEPAAGRAASWSLLFQRLQRAPRPHVLHFICHGRVVDGRAELKLDDERWTPVQALSAALAGLGSAELRLVYLESCSGAEPGALATAAEELADQGVEAVAAHLWTVDARAARDLARDFYGALVGPAGGDLAAAMNLSRLSALGQGRIEHLCPVLVLRGDDPALFDFSERRLVAPRRSGSGAGGAGALDERQQALLRDLEGAFAQPCSLLVGEFVDPEGREEGFKRLWEQMKQRIEGSEQERLSALLQRYELAEEREELRAVVEEVLEEVAAEREQVIPEVIEGLAELSGPGLFLTLLWLPFFEQALAFHHPDDEILVFQPLEPGNLERLRVYRRPPGGRWETLRHPPERLDFARQRVVLRLYGGRNPKSRSIVGNPVLTDDDHLEHLFSVSDLSERLLAFLRNNPLHVAGFSPLDWHHRGLMRHLTDRQPLAPGSFAALSPDAGPTERRYWESDLGPGGRGGDVRVISFEDLRDVLRAILSHRRGDGA